MYYKSVISVLCVLWVAALGAQQGGSVTIGPLTHPPPNTTTTTTTTPRPTTTTTTTTATPPTPNTTTTSTTPSPKTTTSAPTPKPDVKPAVNDFIGNNTNNRTCLMMRSAIQLEILNDKNSTLVNVPKDPDFNIDCDQQSLTVNWVNNSVYFVFSHNETSKKYDIDSITVEVRLPGSNLSYHHSKPAFVVSDKLSYYCAKDEALNLTSGTSNVTVAKLHISHLQYQAFMNSTNPQYASVWDCDGANTSDIVPVIVGCVLAVLVVLVLVVYLFGRRRCQARGYLSM